MATVYSKLVFLDGVLVPTQGISCSWSDEGSAMASVALAPSNAAEKILPSTHVHIFHIETDQLSQQRSVAEIDARQSETRALWAPESRSTLGDVFEPELSFERIEDLRNAVIERVVPYHAIHYRFGGEVISVSMMEQAGKGASVTLNCRGYEHVLERMQAMQLLRGRGTLSEREVRRLGQEVEVFAGRGRNVFYEGLVDLIVDAGGGYAMGIRRLITLYAARINRVWASRMPWTRLPNSIQAIDDDTSVERMLDTSAFRRFIRDTIRQAYTSPLGLRAVIDLLLSMPRYRMVAIPTPAYWPLVPSPPPQFRTEIVETTRRRGGGLYANIDINGHSRLVEPPEADVYGGEWFRGPGETLDQWRYIDEFGVEQFIPVVADIAPGWSGRGELINNNRTVRFTIPLGGEDRGGGELFYGAGATYEYTLDESEVTVEGVIDVFDPLDLAGTGGGEFIEGATYDVTIGNFGVGSDWFPPADLHVSIEIRRSRGERVVVQEETQVEVDPPPQEGLLSNAVSRLSAYAFLPDLWWAVPPACNIVVPDTLRSLTVNDAGMDKITRMIGKIAPGRSGSSRVLIDKFVAPNIGELNESVFDPTDDVHDSTAPTRMEYIGGVVAEVHYFELLHRFVRDEDWESYLRTFIVQQFWSMRIGARQGSAVVKNDMRIVPGAPILIIRALDPTPAGEDFSPEQRCLLQRIAALTRRRAVLQQCRSDLRRSTGGRSTLRAYLRSLINVRIVLEATGAAGDISGDNIDLFRISQRFRVENLEDPSDPQVVAELESIVSARSPGTLTGASLRDFSPRAYVRRITDRLILDLIGEDAALIIAGNGDTLIEFYPSVSTLERWLGLIPSGSNPNAACIDALSADIDLLDRLIQETRDLLREYGVTPGENRAIIAYCRTVSEQMSPGGQESLQLDLTHIRQVGEDLDWDMIAGDDPEAIIAFGEDGYLDAKYAIDLIGEEVYQPIFGCKSLVDLPEVQRRLEEVETMQDEQFDDVIAELPPCDGSDAEAQFVHPEVCGATCVEENSDRATPPTHLMTTTFAARAVAEVYTEIRQNAGSEAALAWLNRARHRTTMTFADAYRDTPIVWGPRESEPDLLQDIERDDEAVWGANAPKPRGFFANTILGPQFDYDRVTITYEVDGDSIEQPLTEDEKDLLRSRLQRVLDFVRSTRGGAYSRAAIR